MGNLPSKSKPLGNSCWKIEKGGGGKGGGKVRTLTSHYYWDHLEWRRQDRTAGSDREVADVHASAWQRWGRLNVMSSTGWASSGRLGGAT